MNDKIVTEKGEHLDIRLPSVTGSMTYHQVASDNDNNDGKQLQRYLQRGLHSSVETKFDPCCMNYYILLTMGCSGTYGKNMIETSRKAPSYDLWSIGQGRRSRSGWGAVNPA